MYYKKTIAANPRRSIFEKCFKSCFDSGFRIYAKKTCRFATESLIYKTKITFWWQNNEKIENRFQCHILSANTPPTVTKHH